MDHSGDFNITSEPTNYNQRVLISHLHNSIYYFIETSFVMKIADDVYRLLVIHEKKVIADRIYHTLLGAKIGYGKLFKKLAWSEEVVPFWSHFYQPDPEWIDKWLSIAGNRRIQDMDMNGNEIRSKTRKFVNRQFDGFDDFKNADNLVEMGIVTDKFIFLLRQFIEKEFNITITVDDGEYFRKKKLSINSIGKLIEEKKMIKVKVDMIKDSRIDVQNGMKELNSMTYMDKKKGGD